MTVVYKTILYDFATQILNRVAEDLEAAGLEVPSRRYIGVGAQGSVSHDCEQLTVTIAQHYPGTPAEQASVGSRCNDPRTVAFVVELVRCVPNLESKGRANGPAAKAPSTEKLNAYSLLRAQDMLVMLETGLEISDSGVEIDGEQISTGTPGMADVTPGNPSGNMQGVIMNLIVNLPVW